MAWMDNYISANDFDAIRLSVASREDILNWSYGEVLKPETINYRTQKPERDGLFCERIFGPVKDINPHDSKLKGVRSREAAVDKEGNLVTKSISRRERMGHISLAAPVAHIWFMRGTPSALSVLLNLTVSRRRGHCSAPDRSGSQHYGRPRGDSPALRTGCRSRRCGSESPGRPTSQGIRSSGSRLSQAQVSAGEDAKRRGDQRARIPQSPGRLRRADYG